MRHMNISVKIFDQVTWKNWLSFLLNRVKTKEDHVWLFNLQNAVAIVTELLMAHAGPFEDWSLHKLVESG